MSDTHMGIIAPLALPNGHGFIGVGARVPAFSSSAVPGGFGPGNIQLMQISPTDGRLPAMPVEVRLFPDRSIGIGLFSDKDNTVLSDWKVPVDQWFYMVVEVNNGTNAPVRMWLYDSNDRLMDKVTAQFATRQQWRHQGRAAQKVGGSSSTTSPMFTYYDDWYVATRFMGPVHISSTGEPLTS
jgi:hypothetical protein